MTHAHTHPPAIVLGGTANALSVARSLSRAGVEVYALNEPASCLRHSRRATWLSCPAPGGPAEWLDVLVGPTTERLTGAVLLCCDDDAIELVLAHRGRLESRYVLEEGSNELRASMLDKLRTYDLAREAGVPTPGYWRVRTVDEVHAVLPELRFPVLLKPLMSHRFQALYGSKYQRCDTEAELLRGWSALHAAGIEVFVVELVEGPDDRLCSYYTYMDATDRPLLHFTKRVIRRFPVNMGGACYHITDDNPEVMRLGLRFFEHVKLRGLGNVEFKRDHRDGQLKLIECNARFTGANSLVVASGIDLPWLVYCALTGRTPPAVAGYARDLRLWFPMRDVRAFRQLRARGELTVGGWLRSLAHPQTFAYFDWRDPAPALALLGEDAADLMAGLSRRVGRARRVETSR